MASRKRYIDDLDSSSEDDFEGIDTSDGSETEESDIEYSSESEDSGDDNIANARDWCEITASGQSAPPRFPFTGTPGITFSVNINYTPLDIFEMFLDSNVMDIIVKETNNYAEQERRANRAKISKFSRSKKWIPTNDREMKLFFGLIFLQGIVQKPNQAMYWSHRRVLHTPVYSKVMTVNRFILLFRYLHFCNNEAEKKEDFSNPKLWKLHNVIENLRQKFCNFYIPERDVSVDESLMPYKGRLSWKQYIPNKRARFGIKFFMLCEAETGYICDFVIYTGNSTVFNALYKNYGLSTKVVMHLMNRFLGNGYCVTVDNYYMSPELADLLIAQKTDIYGTVRINRRDLPKEFAKRKLQKGQLIAFQRGKISAIRWKDKKDVCLMSSIHDTSMISLKNKKNEDILKPKIVSDYNLTMGGVDRCDQEISFHPTIRKRQKKYYKKIFLHLLDKVLWNSFLLYKNVVGKRITFLEFRIQVVEELFNKYDDAASAQKNIGRPSAIDNPARLTERHFISHIPPTPAKREPTRQCKVCCSKKNENGKKIRKETRFWCTDCGVGLCLEKCFQLYHTKLNY